MSKEGCFAYFSSLWKNFCSAESLAPIDPTISEYSEAPMNSFLKLTSEMKNPEYAQLQTLLNILKFTENTAYSKSHDFRGVKSVSDFIQRQPLSSYCDYNSLIQKVVQDGNHELILPEPILFFALSSGTTGPTRKLIPWTRTSRERLTEHLHTLMNDVLEVKAPSLFETLKGKRGVSFRHMGKCSQTKQGILVGGLSTLEMKQKIYQQTIIPIFVSPLEVFQRLDHKSALLGHWKYALMNRKDVYFIHANFGSMIYDAVQLLERGGWKQVLEDIQSEENEHITAQDIHEIALEFLKGFENILGRIFPNLQMINCVVTGSFSMYKPLVERYKPEHVPIFSPAVLSSEGFYAFNTDPLSHVIHYTFHPSSNFFEFILEDDSSQENPNTYLLHDLEVGKKYETVITNFQGLYRYRQGDLVEVVGFHHSTPTINFCGRAGSLLNIYNEMISEATVDLAVKNMSECISNNVIVHFTTIADMKGPLPRYCIYVELMDERIAKEDVALMAAAFDHTLCRENAFYQESLECSELGKVRVKVVKEGAFMRLKQITIEAGAEPSQIKPKKRIDEATANKFESDVILESL